MSTPITDAANAISPQSPAIKKFALLVAAKLEPVVVPPPPPALHVSVSGTPKQGATLTAAIT